MLPTSRFRLLLLCFHCRHSPKLLTSFSFKKAWQPLRFESSQSRANINLEGISEKKKNKPNKTQPQILSSFKWTFFFPKLELFLNPIFSVLNIPCLKQEKPPPSSCLQMKVASSLFAQATKPFLCSLCCKGYSLHKELLYLDYIKKYSLQFADGNFLAKFYIINPLVS